MTTGSGSAAARGGALALAVLLLLLGGLDLATALLGGGAPYVRAGEPATVLGAAARAATAGLVAYALLRHGRAGLAGFTAALVFGLLSVWAPRPVWLHTAANPVFDPYAPFVASLVHLVGLSLFAGAFLRVAGTPDSSAGFWSRQLRGGTIARVALLLPLAGYHLQSKLMFGEWGSAGRALLIGLGALWLAMLAAAVGGGLLFLSRRARAPGEDDDAARRARRALGAFAGAAMMYLLVRLLAGDLDGWAVRVVADLGRPFGPFSLFSVRASAADTAGTVGFSCALLAFAGLLAAPRAPRGVSS